MRDPRDSLLEPGETFAGKYTIIRLVGEGGVGVVFEAHHQRLNQRVALKVLRSEVRRSEEWLARFDREARAAVALRGPHVTRIFDVDSLPDGTPYMVMELLEGHDVACEMNVRGPLPVAEAVGHILQASAAMAEAHALGIVHRDLTPRNLFLAEQDDQRAIKVLDFGISKILTERSDITTSDAAFGTPNYVSPEQIRETSSVGPRADIWSLAVILFEMLTGKLPFEGNSASAMVAAVTADKPKDLRELRPDIPKKLAAAVAKALAKDPADRFQSMEELAEALAPFASPDSAPGELPLSSRPFAATSGSTWARAEVPRPRPQGKGRARWIAAAVIVAAIAIAAPAVRWGMQSDPEPQTSGEAPAAPVTATLTATVTATATATATPTATPTATATATPTPTATATARLSAGQPTAAAPTRAGTKQPAARPAPSRTTKPDTRTNPLHL